MCLQWLSWLRYHNESDFMCYFERFCMFSKGVSWGWKILISGGGLGVERKKFPRLAIARHDPPCNTPLIFTLAWTLYSAGGGVVRPLQPLWLRACVGPVDNKLIYCNVHACGWSVCRPCPNSWAMTFVQVKESIRCYLLNVLYRLLYRPIIPYCERVVFCVVLCHRVSQWSLWLVCDCEMKLFWHFIYNLSSPEVVEMNKNNKNNLNN